MTILLVLILLATICFVLEIFPIDKTALLLLGCLVVFEILSPEEAIAGFSNPALITILCLMIMAHSLEANGVIKSTVQHLGNLRSLPLMLATGIFMLITSSISAFVSTTAVVIVMMKLVNRLHEEYGLSKSRLLMPISFAGILGGSCTLMGTSTNLLVNAIATNHDVEAFGFFEFTLPGMFVLLVSIFFVSLIGPFVLPKVESSKRADRQRLDELITHIRILPGSESVGKPLKDTPLFLQPETMILSLTGENYHTRLPGRHLLVQPDQVYLVKTSLAGLNELAQINGLSILNRQEQIRENISDPDLYAELLLLPNSNLVGKSLADLEKISLQQAIPLAVHKRKTFLNPLTHSNLHLDPTDQANLLSAGDSLLVQTTKEGKEHLQALKNIMVVNEYDVRTSQSTVKKWLSFLIVVVVILLAASATFSILKSVLIGVSLLLLFQCISLADTYESINWPVIFLLAAMIPISTAMENTGTDTFLVENLKVFFTGFEPTYIVSLVLLITMLASGFISNNAVAIVMTPVALGLATQFQIPVKALLVAVMFGANFSFFTPVGYQTNTLIYALGLYRFKHFLYLGGMVSIIAWLLSTYLIALFFLH